MPSGSTNSYTLMVSGSGNSGLDVAASGGTFTSGSGTQVMSGEITQTSASSSHTWTFKWTAPTVTSTTSETMYGAAIDSYGGGTGTAAPTITVTAAVSNPSLTMAPASLNFSYITGGSVPGSQSISVGSSGAALSYTVAASGGSWLSASGGATTPGNVSVSVNPGSMSAGTYNGTVTITSSGAANSPQTVPVTLKITSAASPTLSASPSSLDFAYTVGGSNPAAQSFTVSSSGSALSYTVAASGGSWLSAGGGGNTPGNVSVSANASGMTAGTYNGSVTVTSSGASTGPLTIPVVLKVSSSGGGGSLAVHPTRLVFYSDGSEPSPQNVVVNSTGSQMSFTAEAFGGTWMSLGASGGNTPDNLSISTSAAGLPGGTYSGVVQIKGGSSTIEVEIVLVVGAHRWGGGDDGNGQDGGQTQAQPFTFDPGAQNNASAMWQGGASGVGSQSATLAGLVLTKRSSGPATAISGALIMGASGSTLRQLGFDLQAGGECTAKAPQFVVITNDNVVHRAGCSQGRTQASSTTGWKRVSFDPADASQFSPAVQQGAVVKTIALVMDQVSGNGTAVLAHINLNGTQVSPE